MNNTSSLIFMLEPNSDVLPASKSAVQMWKSVSSFSQPGLKISKNRSFGILLYAGVMTQCQGAKTSAMIVEKQSGKRHFQTIYFTVRKKRKSFKDSSSWEWKSQQIQPKVQTTESSEKLPKPKCYGSDLQASVSMLYVKVHDSTIRKRLNKDSDIFLEKGSSL